MIRTTRVEIETHDIVLVIFAILMLVYMFFAVSVENRKLNVQQDIEQAKIEANCNGGENNGRN